MENLIHTLTAKEQQEFIRFLNRKNQRGDTKNVELFTLLVQAKTEDVDVVLYGGPNKNAYYALRARLLENLIDFIAVQGFARESSEELKVLKLLLAGRILFEQQHHALAFKTLRRAEQLAVPLELYPIIHEIYQTALQYAHLRSPMNFEKLLSKSSANFIMLQQEFRWSQAYAFIKVNLVKTNPLEVQELIHTAFAKFNIALDERLTYKSLCQLMQLTATSADLRQDYYSVNDFMLEVYELVNAKSGQADKYFYYHLEILWMMATSFFRNKDFKRSMLFLNDLCTEMHKKEGRFVGRFAVRERVLFALNLNFSRKPLEALEVLEAVKDRSLDATLPLIMCLFQQGRFSGAYAIFRNLNHSDVWYEKKMDWIWVVKKSLLEILLLIELDQIDLVPSRLRRFDHKFKARLLEVGEERAVRFAGLVGFLYQNLNGNATGEFKKRVENSFEWLGSEREDIFVMCFYAWLKAKWRVPHFMRPPSSLLIVVEF